MAEQQDFSNCAFCFESFTEDRKKNAAHIIPRDSGGCDHKANLVDACEDCNKGSGGQWTDTPLEWWAKQNWDVGQKPDDVSQFDFGGYTLADRRQFLLQAAYWEARARLHLEEDHDVKAVFVTKDTRDQLKHDGHLEIQ